MCILLALFKAGLDYIVRPCLKTEQDGTKDTFLTQNSHSFKKKKKILVMVYENQLSKAEDAERPKKEAASRMASGAIV
jgi:hypothetical protein